MRRQAQFHQLVGLHGPNPNLCRCKWEPHNLFHAFNEISVLITWRSLPFSCSRRDKDWSQKLFTFHSLLLWGMQYFNQNPYEQLQILFPSHSDSASRVIHQSPQRLEFLREKVFKGIHSFLLNHWFQSKISSSSAIEKFHFSLKHHQPTLLSCIWS